MTVATLLFALAGMGPHAGYWQPGGYEARIGSPYYYSVHTHGGWHNRGPAHSGCGCGSRHRAGHHAWYGGNAHHHSTWTANPYTYHFGPGYYRHAEHGHYRFPYYSYRRPWYYPGQPVFNRDTNFAW